MHASERIYPCNVSNIYAYSDTDPYLADVVSASPPFTTPVARQGQGGWTGSSERITGRGDPGPAPFTSRSSPPVRPCSSEVHGHFASEWRKANDDHGPLPSLHFPSLPWDPKRAAPHHIHVPPAAIIYECFVPGQLYTEKKQKQTTLWITRGSRLLGLLPLSITARGRNGV